MIGKKYQRITEWIQNRIERGELSAGDKLESENEISVAFGISRQTVRHALSLLEKDGILVKVQGSGTYVKGRSPRKAKNVELSKTVTIISTYIDGYIFPRILKEMVRVLEEAGYGVRIMYTGNRLETERLLLKRLIEEGSRDPLIVESVMSGLPNPNLDYYRELQEKEIPILFFHSSYPELSLPCVRMDDVEAGRMAAGYLISQGHKRIGGIFKADDGQGKRRYEGMIQAMYEAGIEVREERICWIDSMDLRNTAEMDARIQGRLSDCTACVCYNDEVAHTLTAKCQKQGIAIPQDLSVVSIDNSVLARLNAVPLTSVAHPMERLGRKAAENMIALIKDASFDANCLFSPTLEVRDSVAKYEERE